MRGDKNSGWDAYRRLAAAGIPTAARTADNIKEKTAREAYMELPPRAKARVDSWRNLGNSWADSIRNSDVLTETRRTTQKEIIVSSEQATRDIFVDLPWQAKDVVRQWLATNGNNLRDALIRSNALGIGELITPRDARREELRKNDYRQAAEHEAAHAVVAQALGLNVKHAKIFENGGGGECIHAKGTRLQEAIILMAPELWINRFRRDQFPSGAKGLKSDNSGLIEIGDKLILRNAMDHCMAILRQNRALMLATADQIEKYGRVTAPWQ